MIFEFEGKRFDVDIDTTKEYYKTHSLCDCDACRNFYVQVKDRYPALHGFLEKFGVDISKPDEICWLDAKDGGLDYIAVYYTVNGEILETDSYEIDIQDTTFVNVVVDKDGIPCNQKTEKYFVLSVYGVVLPYIREKLIRTQGGFRVNFEITNELLETLKPYTEKSTISVSTDNKDWRGGPYQADVVTIDEEHRVGFDVVDNEIIVFYFGDHKHFEDYTSELQEDQDNYIKRAKDFMIELFDNRLKHVERYSGKKLASDKYYIIYSDNTEEFIGGTWYGLVRFINPFARKTEKTTIWRFEKSQGRFIQ